MTPPPGQSGSNPLPPKEQALFKKIVKCYEHKQYKNGLKFAKQILANPKYSEHGETLAMRGLILNCMGKSREAHEVVKLGLTRDLKSHVCWHVFGLLQRADKNYDGAIKAYHNAIKLDKDNMQILRDLSLLQIQMRDLEGYRDTRYRLLVLRPTQRASWIGYAMAYHLLGDFDMALKILGEFVKTQTPNDLDFEFSELTLYYNMVLRESGKFSEALEHLEQNSSTIADKLAYHETRADLLITMGRLTDASAVYRQLIDRNPENHFYYKSVERCEGMASDSPDEQMIERRLQLYRDAEKSNPRSAACKRLPLTFLKGAAFLERLGPYLMTGLRKGVPSLFQNVRCLYDDPAKAVVIERMLLSYAKNLETHQRFTIENDNDMTEAPTTILWVCLFLAQHYDRLGDFESAMHYIDKAIDHTPTLIELLVIKAKIFKHAGNNIEAVHWMEQAQALDTADRYINCKAAKYMLRAGLVRDAERMCGKFTREGVPAMQSLNEMQCMWFETESAKSYRKLGHWGDSLKKCHEVERHFTGIVEDQFDFHTYCVRKMTLCAYVGLLRLEDILKRHRFFFRAATHAVKIYLQLHERPYDPSGLSGLNNSKLTPNELRKQMRKNKKKAAQQEANKKQQQQQQQQQALSQKNKPDPDLENTPFEPLDPEVLVKCENPLDEAAKFIWPLINLESVEIKAYTLGFEVYYRKGKLLPMLQCLKRAHSIDVSHPKLHVCRIKYLLFYLDQSLDDGPVKEIALEVMSEIFATTDPKQLNAAFRTAHGSSAVHRIAIGESSWLLKEESHASILAWIQESLAEKNSPIKDWKLHRRFMKLLEAGAFGPSPAEECQTVRKLFATKFPQAKCFRSIVANEVNGQMEDKGEPLSVEE